MKYRLILNIFNERADIIDPLELEITIYQVDMMS